MSEDGSRWSRRTVAGIIVAACAWPITAVFGAQKSTLLQSSPPRPEAAIVSLFREPVQASALGAACLLLLPELERTVQSLSASVLPVEVMTTFQTQEAIHQYIITRIADDFRREMLINVGGWLLSLTEVRVYALVALSAGHIVQI